MTQRQEFAQTLSNSTQPFHASENKSETKTQDDKQNEKTKSNDYFPEISSFWPIGLAQTTLNVIYRGGSAVKGFFIKKWSEDVYQLNYKPNDFILDVMYKRARANNNVAWIDTAPAGLSNGTFGHFPRRFYMIAGGKANISSVNAEGEKKKEKSKSLQEWLYPSEQYARFFFNHAIKALKKKTLVNRTGTEALNEKNRIRKYLVGDEPIRFAHEVTDNLFRYTMTHWDPEISFQDQMTYLGVNVIGQCVVGFPEVKMSHIPDIRKAGKTLALPFDATEKKLEEAGNIVNDLNQKIYDDAQELIKNPSEVAAKYFEQRGFALDDPKSIRENLIHEEVDRHLIVADGNLSFTIMSVLVLLNLYPDVKERLRAEVIKFKQDNSIPESTELTASELKQLPYLDCIYFETLRCIASVPVTPRMTSETMELSVQGTDKKPHQIQVPKYSYLFAALRPAHLDPSIWKEPRVFNPSRFENDPKNELRNQVNAFSEGPRGCPARLGFTEACFRKFVINSLDWMVFLTKKPSNEIPSSKIDPFVNVPICTMDAFWPEEYYAVVMPDPKSNKLNPVRVENNDSKDPAQSALNTIRCRA